MNKEDVETWNRANNIIPEYCDLFEDFSFSLFYLINGTYLGFSHGNSNDRKIGVKDNDKLKHFRWCFDKIILDFKKENIVFNFSNNDYDFFRYVTDNEDVTIIFYPHKTKSTGSF